LNPLSYLDSVIVDPSREKVAAKSEHALVGSALFGIPSYGMWLLSGGGATPAAARGARPGMMAIYGVKQHIQKTFVGAAVNTARRLPGAVALAVLFGIGQGLQSAYYEYSGMHIGDIRFVR
jgi:hypothetical protein